jgi:hypothetical protein
MFVILCDILSLVRALSGHGSTDMHSIRADLRGVPAPSNVRVRLDPLLCRQDGPHPNRPSIVPVGGYLGTIFNAVDFFVTEVGLVREVRLQCQVLAALTTSETLFVEYDFVDGTDFFPPGRPFENNGYIFPTEEERKVSSDSSVDPTF